jgi:hypothetical protein
MADIFGAAKDWFAGNQKAKAAKKTARANAQARQQGMDLIANQDWEPDLASDHVAPYQRSQSPVARGFLESFLTGANPAAVQGTRAGAGLARGQAQDSFRRDYGGWDDLRAKQREMEQSTPWAVKPFEGPVIGESQRFNTSSPGLAKGGLDAQAAAELRDAGLVLDPATGLPTKGTDIYTMMALKGKDPKEYLPKLLAAVRSGRRGWQLVEGL